ncbi:MAG: ATP-binding cassette domain-containing protein, partial [Anaerolineae bacterium]|nr:ATP-binding cassette domain-containing protein [Anaerolineae bacterium]
MPIQITGAQEHNLQNLDVAFEDGLTVVTGVSGSGKTSLVFDTLYHEAQRRFLEIFSLGKRLAPAHVRSITGIGPAVAVGQNLLNRNPASTLATASGLHPFLRLLYARFGERACARCGSPIAVLAEDDIVEQIVAMSTQGPLAIFAPLVHGAKGSHHTLLSLLCQTFGAGVVWVDGQPCTDTIQPLPPGAPHDIAVQIAAIEPGTTAAAIRAALQQIWALGANAVQVANGESASQRVSESADQRAGSGANYELRITNHEAQIPPSPPHPLTPSPLLPPPSQTLSRAPVCAACGAWFGELLPTHFNRACPACDGVGCNDCAQTGLHPSAAAVTWDGLRLPELLALSVDDAHARFAQANLPATAGRLAGEITRRLEALQRVGLGYIALDRSSPTLSRGESQRVRLAVALTSRLEDVLHVLDEPTIGLHPADVARLLPAFRDLGGPVVYVEHDRIAAACADHALDIGPGAGSDGGRVLFAGTPAGLWQADTATGRYFSLRERVSRPERRPDPGEFLTVQGASLRTLRGFDAPIPLGRLTVVTGVSGSGKSTFVEDVLAASLDAGKPVGCSALDGPQIKAVMVDQSPIGKNPRSNPATYTKLADVVRDVFAGATGLSPSHFSFNRPEGQCPACEGLGAVEVTLRYLPSTWIPCAACDGARFSDEVLSAVVAFGAGAKIHSLNIADFYALPIREAAPLLIQSPHLPDKSKRAARHIIRALEDIGLGYLTLGQPSPTLSGGEAQRVKLAKFLGQRSLEGQVLILDEPSTGLHPQNVAGLLTVLDRLARHGATIVVVEHNSDIIRAADWVLDLGPGAGPDGGRLIYAGPPDGLDEAEGSLTGRALREEDKLQIANSESANQRVNGEAGEQVREEAAEAIHEGDTNPPLALSPPLPIQIRGARAHNLRSVDVDFPKGAFTVVTGVSGSGKSSLVGDVLEAEARRRFLETLSMYERQGLHEGPEAPVDSVSGLGVTVIVNEGGRGAFGQRNTVGAVTEIARHLAVLFAYCGERVCPHCGSPLARIAATRQVAESHRGGMWQCSQCEFSAPLPAPRHFDPGVYAAACRTCHGVGSLRQPNPGKLIVAPELPLCGGAMYSPGFFPKGYLCKPMNGGYEVVQALGQHLGFDPATTPWNQMSKEAQDAFLFGYPEKLRVVHQSRKGTTSEHWWHMPGFFGWIRDWDVGGTYTDDAACPDCQGARLRPEYASVTLGGHTLHALSGMALAELLRIANGELQITNGELQIANGKSQIANGGTAILHRQSANLPVVSSSLETIRRRLDFLIQVGLGYLHLDRDAATLSAGEAQRIKLAGLLGSGLTSLTILVDEPTRGMHPVEIDALIAALHNLRDEGNTVIVVEHDPGVMRAADYLVDVGPGAGAAGGEIVAAGTPDEVMRTDSLTARWLRRVS